MNIKIKQTFNISMVLIISFLMTKVVGDIFFISDSPVLRSNPALYMAKKVDMSVSPLLALLRINKTGNSQTLNATHFASIEDFNQALSKAVDVPMKQVAKGTYAATVQGKEVQIIKLNEIPYKEYTYTINGKQVKIRVPETMSPPTENEVKSVEGL